MNITDEIQLIQEKIQKLNPIFNKKRISLHWNNRNNYFWFLLIKITGSSKLDDYQQLSWKLSLSIF